MTEEITSWGKAFHFKHEVYSPYWQSDAIQYISNTDQRKILAYGLGRSYGDICLNAEGHLIKTNHLNRFISFDHNKGMLECESGVTLSEILHTIVPYGWFLPVCPGTKYITLGGAIANDIHGKNHHIRGTFGHHLQHLRLARSDGSVQDCSPHQNGDLFRATIGGLGLTGLILSACFKLIPIQSAFLDVETIKFYSIDDFFALNDTAEKTHEYVVSWIDCLARGKNVGRGHLIKGRFCEGSEFQNNFKLHPTKVKLAMPMDLPPYSLNRWSVSLFNSLYFARKIKDASTAVTHYDPFFYPLDGIHHWNRLYGKRGFYQYQFVIDKSQREVLVQVLHEIAESGVSSFLSVLKTFGSIDPAGLLSFPKSGFTLAADFPNYGLRTYNLFKKLDNLISKAGGRVYLAKDANIPSNFFQHSYPQWKEFEQYIDPQFSSNLWKRLRPSSS